MIKYQLEIQNKINQKWIKRKLNHLNIRFVKSNEKVAYYYEDIKTNTVFSFNANTTFYAASTIKILPIIYLFEKKINLEQELEITKEDIKQGSGILKEEKILPKKYTILKLMKYSIQNSDNTAYIKLVNWIGKENLIQYGKNLGATHSLEGKDLFGITSCNDLICYWKSFFKIQQEHPEIKEWFLNPTYQIIQQKSIDHNEFLRKYGSFDIAYHECGIVFNKNPYFLIILTQKGESKKSKKFVNYTAKNISKIHKKLNQIK